MDLKTILGDCIEEMKKLEPNSIDAIITDPPYGLEFMGKEWDKLTRNLMRAESESDKKRLEKYGKSYQGMRSRLPDLAGSQKHSNEMQSWHFQWTKEAFRILKPGGSMFVMGGTRTFHRLMVAIEDSGFILKDTLAFMYGSGFPKAQALSTGLTDRFLQVSLQGVFHWKSKSLGFRSDYQENCRLCDEQLQSSLTVFLNADLIQVDAPEHNHLSLREFSIHLDSEHKNKASVSSVFFHLSKQDFSPLSFALPKDAFARVSKLNGIVPILIDGNLPSSKLLLDALHEWHNDMYLNNNKSFPDEAMPLALKIIYHNGHILIESYHNHNDKCASYFEQLKNRVVQKFSHKYRILPTQKDHLSYSSFCGMSPVAYIHFSKSCKNCQAKIYQTLIDYEGYKCGGLKPAWEPIVYAYKPVEKSIVDNVLKWGVGAVNVDECRVGYKDENDSLDAGEHSSKSPQETIYKTGLNPRGNDRQGTKGRFPANILLSHHPECARRGVKKVTSNARPNCDGKEYGDKTQDIFGKFKENKHKALHIDPDGLETVADWECHPECAVKMLDEQSGDLKSGGGDKGNKKGVKGWFGLSTGNEFIHPYMGDSGGASRFFYTAKASRFERNEGLEGMEKKERKTQGRDVVSKIDRKDGRGIVPVNAKIQPSANIHPTVKPISLFEWLIKLVTRKGQLVLDPFLGSGTTLMACEKSGRKGIGIEKESEYMEIAKTRIKNFSYQKTLNFND